VNVVKLFYALILFVSLIPLFGDVAHGLRSNHLRVGYVNEASGGWMFSGNWLFHPDARIQAAYADAGNQWLRMGMHTGVTPHRYTYLEAGLRWHGYRDSAAGEGWGIPLTLYYHPIWELNFLAEVEPVFDGGEREDWRYSFEARQNLLVGISTFVRAERVEGRGENLWMLGIMLHLLDDW
jgi:hypothetical protein